MTEEREPYGTEQDRNMTIKDTPLSLAAIQAFRDMLDVMEEFIRNTEQEEREIHE